MRDFENSFSLNVNNHKVSYTDEGKYGAPVIIFIHGFPFNKSMWRSQIGSLTNFCRVIAYDIRGFGNSESGREEFTIELFAKDLISLMDVLKIDKTMLCGLSMGGYISLNAVSNFPERFNALVLSDTQCTADTPEAREKRMKTIKSIRENGVEKYADESIKNLFSPESFLARKDAIEDVRDMILKTSEQSLFGTLLALAMREETCSKLSEIKVPVLIMVGKEDILTPPAAALLMNEKIKNSSLHIIDHSGHLSNMENPYKFNYELKKFVSAVY
jgi:pimeloyl-ACP methyl ester carboxylesterase